MGTGGNDSNGWSRARGVILKTMVLVGGALLLKRLTKSTTRWDHARFVSDSLTGDKFSQDQASRDPDNFFNLRSNLGSVYRFCSNVNSFEIDLSNEESKRRIFNRLLYRSKQRGFLELDLVLGKWVEDHISSMDESGIKALVHVLDLENPDLWKWLTGQEQPPETVNDNQVFSAHREKVMGNLNNHASPETRATPGQPWVRGWDDLKRARDSPISGNQ